MNDLKTLRDKLNGSLPLCDGETRCALLSEWENIHGEMESQKHNNDENFTEFKVMK